MFKLKTKYSPFIQLFSSIASLIVGLLFIVNYDFVWRFIHSISLILAFLFALSNLVKIDVNKKRLSISVSLQFLLALAGFVFINVKPALYVSLFPFFMGLYILFLAITRFIKFIVYLTDGLKYRYIVLLEAIITLIFALGLIVSPLDNINYLSYYVGVYFIFYGISDLIKALNKLIFAKDAQYSMPVPIFIAALLPKTTLLNIDKITTVETIDKKSDLEVFIYLRSKGFGQFGHMDFSFQGKTYSYGSFDPHTQKLSGGYGDGVLIVCDRDQFIIHGNVFKEATIIKFGLTLNDKQKQLIKNRINTLMQRTITHYSDAKIDEINNVNQDKIYNTYLSNLYVNTKADSYKFKSGKFKTYFVMTTNCVNVVDYILQMKNLDLINIKGILTPGTYLEFLNNEYLANSKIVTSRYVYQSDAHTNRKVI